MTDVLSAIKIAVDLMTAIFNAIQSGASQVSVDDIQKEIARIKSQQLTDEQIEEHILRTGQPY